MAQCLRALAVVHPEALGSVPNTHTSGGSQLSVVIPAPGEAETSGLCRHFYSCTYPYAETHAYI